MEKTVKLSDIKPYPNNPRDNDDAVAVVAESIKQCGYIAPIIVDEDMVVLAGHTRLRALKKLGYKEVEIKVVDGLTDEQKKKYRLLDNKTNEFAEWDIDKLTEELEGLDFEGFDFGFDIEEDDAPAYDDFKEGSLKEKYICPPFSVIDSSAGYWMDRKNEWKKIIHSEDGRDDEILGSGLKQLAKKQGQSEAQSATAGISIFDPVLTETLIAWFCPEKGKIIDCFSGGSVRGLVAAYTGHEYVGMDLRQEQIDANERNYEELKDTNDFYGNILTHPTWLCGDSCTIDTRVDGEYDFMLTCPPYADLEVYSDDPKDLSNMEYADFRKAYFEIIKKTTAKLKDNAYAAIVIGEVRSKSGDYYNFVGDTIEAFKSAGLRYYNEIILKSPIGTAALRGNRTFGTLRKVVKIHQNVLVFVKGDEKKIKLSEYTYEFPED